MYQFLGSRVLKCTCFIFIRNVVSFTKNVRVRPSENYQSSRLLQTERSMRSSSEHHQLSWIIVFSFQWRWGTKLSVSHYFVMYMLKNISDNMRKVLNKSQHHRKDYFVYMIKTKQMKLFMGSASPFRKRFLLYSLIVGGFNYTFIFGCHSPLLLTMMLFIYL